MSAVRLDKLLANLGYGSRKDIAMLVREEVVVLDGAPLPAADRRVTREEAARLEIDGEPVDPLPGVVLALNKPLGVTCSHREAGPLVYALLPERWRRRDPAISSIGRLDKETSGLLLLTDDGALLHRIISPKAKIAKRYRARLARPLREDAATIFASGALMLEGETTPLLPAALEIVSPQDVLVSVTEGRYHQVRRMFAALGNHVEALHRETVGGYALPPHLEPGAFEIMTATALASVFEGHGPP